MKKMKNALQRKVKKHVCLTRNPSVLDQKHITQRIKNVAGLIVQSSGTLYPKKIVNL